jgi:hypothetical protein
MSLDFFHFHLHLSVMAVFIIYLTQIVLGLFDYIHISFLIHTLNFFMYKNMLEKHVYITFFW